MQRSDLETIDDAMTPTDDSLDPGAEPSAASASGSREKDYTGTEESTGPRGLRFGLVLAPLLSAGAYWGLGRASSLGGDGRAVAAVAVLMAVLWLTEAIAIEATSLLPLVALPLLTRGGISIRSAAAPYANEMIFLFLGGFLIALGMQRWGLHRRVAMRVLLVVGTRPSRLVLGFLLSSALLSMWISNTATAVMMMPIAMSVVELVRQRQLEASGDEGGAEADSAARGTFPFAICLLLATAYGASVGGTATLIGTPPNLFMSAFVAETFGKSVSFLQWLKLGLPFAAVLLPVIWLLLVRVLFPIRVKEIPGGREFLYAEMRRLGRMGFEERCVLAVFALAALLWVSHGPLADSGWPGTGWLEGVSDPSIAIGAGLLLFILPARRRDGVAPRRLMAWKETRDLPWGVLLLFGGGLSLAGAVRSSGLDAFVGKSLVGLGALPEIVLVALVTLVIVLLTELTSNAATTATFLPILAATAQAIGMDPMKLVVPATLAASCAFMLPVATPPNAIVFGTGELSIRQMARAGIWLNLVSWIWIVVIVRLIHV